MIVAKAFYISSGLLKNKTIDLKHLPSDTVELVLFSEIPVSPYETAIKVEEANLPYFGIIFDEEPTEENLLLLARATFLKRFKKQDDKITIFFKRVSAPEKIEAYLQKQGYAEVNLLDLEQMVPFEVGSFSGFIDKSSGQILLLEVTGSEQVFAGNEKEINNALSLFSATSELIEQNNFLTKENAWLKDQKSELLAELSNHKKYLEIALKQKETERILNFYHKEYEVLPLWYKRIGHVLKAVMGKRNISSLFKN